MRFDAQETPTFRGGPIGTAGPAIAEAMVLYDRAGNIVATFAKDAATGAVTLVVAGDITDGSGNTVSSLLATANAFVPAGVIDCSTNPNYPAANKGDVYVVSVAGKIGGASGTTVEAGDWIICNTDSTTAGTEAAKGTYWWHVEHNIVGAEIQGNKDVSGGYVGKTLEKINFWNAARTFMSFIVNAATAARTYTFPDKDITVAGISDVTVTQAQTGSSITPCPDGTVSNPTSITTVKGIITAIS